MLSPFQEFVSKHGKEKAIDLIASMSVADRAKLASQWKGWFARPNQLEPDGDWIYWLVMAGRGFGKTRMGAEWVRACVKQGFRKVNIAAPTLADARKILIEGGAGILSVCPEWERPTWNPSKYELHWPNGAKTLVFSGEEPDRFRGHEHERLWMDELAHWEYEQDCWDMAMMGLRAGADARVCITTTPLPVQLLIDLLENEHCVITSGSTYDNLSNLAPAFHDIIRKYENTRLGRQELEGELLLDEGLAYRFSEAVHTFPDRDFPDTWQRDECMDYGSNAPTAWYPFLTDYDGNTIVSHEYYVAGLLPSQHAPAIKDARKRWNPRGDDVTVYADPSVYDNKGVTGRWNRPANVADEYREHDIRLAKAENDRVAGYVRLSELLRQDEKRMYPQWHPRAGEMGAPRLFIAHSCKNLIYQMRWARIETDDGKDKGPHPSEAVSREWERSHGHGHAALRYGMMSRPSPSEHPEQYIEDPRRRHFVEMLKAQDEEDPEEIGQF